MDWQLEEFRFDPATNVLTGPAGPVLLEPKPSALLAYFIEHAGRDISRDELIEHVWARQIVSDGAINRVVVQLRKALGDDDKIKRFIVTVPKVGYRFVGPVSPAADEQPAGPRPRWVTAVPVIGLLVFAVLTLIILNSDPPPASPAMTIAPLVRLSTEQFDAAPAPDGEGLVYSQKTQSGTQLYWRGSTDAEAIAVGAPGGRASGAAWAPGGSRIAYHFATPSSCEIHLLAITADGPGVPEAVHACEPGSAVSLAFSKGGGTLYLTESAGPFDPSVLYALDLATGARTQPAQPIARGRGNHRIDVHPDTGRLLLLNDETPGRTSAYRLDPTSGTYERLLRWPYRVDHAVWGHTAGTIVHPGGHPSYDLMQTDYTTGAADILVSDSRRITSPQRIANGRDYLFTSYLYNRDIWVDGSPAPELNSSVMDYLPTLSRAGGQLAFISKRTGDSLVWLHEFTTGGLRSVSPGREALSIVGLDWSFDDSQLLVTSSQGLWVIEVSSGDIIRHIETRLPAYGAVWTGAETISFSQRENGRWRAYDISMPDGTPTPAPGSWAFRLASERLSMMIDQAYVPWRAGAEGVMLGCGPAIRNRHLTYHVRGESFFCPERRGQGVVRWSLGGATEILPGLATSLMQYSVAGGRTAHMVEATAVSDIMRTVSAAP